MNIEVEPSEKIEGEWEQVGYFGNSKIMARGDERKLEEEGKPDFHYTMEDLIEDIMEESNSKEVQDE